MYYCTIYNTLYYKPIKMHRIVYSNFSSTNLLFDQLNTLSKAAFLVLNKLL